MDGMLQPCSGSQHGKPRAAGAPPLPASRGCVPGDRELRLPSRPRDALRGAWVHHTLRTALLMRAGEQIQPAVFLCGWVSGVLELFVIKTLARCQVWSVEVLLLVLTVC